MTISFIFHPSSRIVFLSDLCALCGILPGYFCRGCLPRANAYTIEKGPVQLADDARNDSRQNAPVVLSEYREDVYDAIRGLQVLERPIPKLRRGQVLVKMSAARAILRICFCYKADTARSRRFPTVPGWEGAGTVVASGGGWLAWWLRGKRVACALRADRDGTWAEYFVANANNCIPLKAALPVDQAASLIMNPFTAMGLLDRARRAGHEAAVHTAGSSQLGRMMIAMAADMNYPVINVVRRDAQVDILKSLGSKHVLNSVERSTLRLSYKRSAKQLERNRGVRSRGRRYDRHGAQRDAAWFHGVRLSGTFVRTMWQYRPH